MSFYDRATATAIRMVEKFGAPVFLVFQESSEYDPETGDTDKKQYTYTGRGVLLDYEARDVDGQSIQATDQRVYIAPNIAVPPSPGNKLEIAGERWEVIVSKPVAPGGITVLYDVQVRR